MPAAVKPPASPAAARLPGWTWLAVGGLVLALYGRTVAYGLTNYDDYTYLVRNPLLHRGDADSFLLLFVPGAVPGESLYAPLTYLSFWLESAVTGGAPWLFHLTNVILHLANCLLVLRLAQRLGFAALPATLAAMLFAVHPVQVETVAWAFGRKDLLAATFGLLAALAWLRHLDAAHRLWLIASLVLCGAAALAKPAMVALPATFVVLGWLRGGDIRRTPWLALAPFALLAGVVLGLNRLVRDPVPEVDRTYYWLDLLLVPGTWFRNVFLLDAPAPFYARPGFELSRPFVVGAATAVLLGYLVYWLLRADRRQVTGGLLFATVAMVPALSVPLGHRAFLTADRYGYFPMVGVFLALAALPALLPERRRRLGYGLGFGVILLAFVLATPQVAIWRTSETLWQAARRHAPDAPWINYQLAQYYAQAGRPADSVEPLQRVVAAVPLNPQTRFLLAAALAETGQAAAARREATRLTILDPRHLDAWLLLGRLCHQAGDHAGAARAFTQALKLDPNCAEARAGLGGLQPTPASVPGN